MPLFLVYLVGMICQEARNPEKDQAVARALKNDPRLYFDSISRTPGSKYSVLDAIHDEGKDTVLRMCIAPVGEDMPLRTLGYVASLLHLHRSYMPKARLELVTPVHTLQRVNGNGDALAAAHDLRKDLGIFDVNMKPPLHLMIDTPDVPAVDVEAIRECMTGTKEEARLASQAAKRGDPTSYPHYVAGHMALYHTVEAAQPLMGAQDYETDSNVDRLIVLGAQSERVFDNALAICSKAGVTIEGRVSQTGLVYPKNVRPPYLVTQPDPEGTVPYFDPLVPDYMALFDYAHFGDPDVIKADPTKRDLAYTREALLFALGFQDEMTRV